MASNYSGSQAEKRNVLCRKEKTYPGFWEYAAFASQKKNQEEINNEVNKHFCLGL